jgi:hypothetical protein
MGTDAIATWTDAEGIRQAMTVCLSVGHFLLTVPRSSAPVSAFFRGQENHTSARFTIVSIRDIRENPWPKSVAQSAALSIRGSE